jgi:hypothetical protein
MISGGFASVGASIARRVRCLCFGSLSLLGGTDVLFHIFCILICVGYDFFFQQKTNLGDATPLPQINMY